MQDLIINWITKNAPASAANCDKVVLIIIDSTMILITVEGRKLSTRGHGAYGPPYRSASVISRSYKFNNYICIKVKYMITSYLTFVV